MISGEVVVTMVSTLLVCLINNIFQNKYTRNLIEYRLEKLEQEVHKHNNVIERTYELEKRDKVEEEQIKVINHRIDDLERKLV